MSYDASRRLVVPLLVCGLALTACGGGKPPAANAVVTGIVRGYGGPAIVVHGKPRAAINGAPEAGQRITATRSDGLVVRAATAPDGRYAIGLPPGRYKLQAACSLPVSLSVRSAQRLRVPLRCDFP